MTLSDALRYNTKTSVAKDLISHLLCVDPAQRYTIDEFLNHPWCKEAVGSMPPPRTPRNAPLDSPLLMGMAGGRSPGVAQLKEAFDITYAVHRMEEEGNRRKGFLTGVNEEDESDDDAMVVDAAKQRQGNANPVNTTGVRSVNPTKTVYQEQRDAGRAGPRDRGDRKRGFELNMGGATLLG